MAEDQGNKEGEVFALDSASGAISSISVDRVRSPSARSGINVASTSAPVVGGLSTLG